MALQRRMAEKGRGGAKNWWDMFVAYVYVMHFISGSECLLLLVGQRQFVAYELLPLRMGSFPL